MMNGVTESASRDISSAPLPEKRGLGAAPHVHLREDAVHVGLDCTLPDEELARDLLVGFAPSQELQDLRLAPGKGLRAFGGAHLAHQARRGLRGEVYLA